ncbi:helix-turn-helix transcriptional regulator [Mariniflexile soesokkakense]|uniref:Helix-turn-helix transcriptional regulator n=1 Tax=Mariniflexile soesokkakense TaxID=1343160 RepID=A0ABV0A5V8_9FLAO
MSSNTINIAPITNKTTTKNKGDFYTVCWIKNDVLSIEIDKVVYKNISNSIFFLNSRIDWKITKKNTTNSSGYVLYLPKAVLDNPLLSQLHINEVVLFSANEIPKISLAPGIEKRIQAILEMLDELLGSHLKHKDDAIISLLNTFFVYCDGQCNIKSIISESSTKKTIVYKFKKLVDKHISECHEVSAYARLLNISNSYLNECVKEILGVKAMQIITEQRIMRSRHELKFTNKSVKEIGFEMGFSSPDYFSYFFKKHTGITPSALR